ncbi:MAG TPA: hypothetical protein VN739_10340 [Nitrososphaerales archaeon]|nr:hypothetical protein [Nitrososphaerales archaeon]
MPLGGATFFVSVFFQTIPITSNIIPTIVRIKSSAEYRVTSKAVLRMMRMDPISKNLNFILFMLFLYLLVGTVASK